MTLSIFHGNLCSSANLPISRFAEFPYAIQEFFVSNLPAIQPLSHVGQAQDNPNQANWFVPIQDVVKVVEQSLQAVQAQLEPGDPHLKSAEFDFQTITTKDVTGGFFASLVTLQAEHDKVKTREVDFTYSVPDQQHALLMLKRLEHRSQHLKSDFYDAKLGTNCTQDVVSVIKCLWDKIHQTTTPEEISETLPGAIVAAARSARDVSQVTNSGGDLCHRSFTIVLTYQVKNTLSGDADPSSLISVGPQLKFSNETDRTQTLKLTFEDSSKPTPGCHS